ncbi:DUF1996 domain-containing protein [Nonomuraea angiospora]|uniref:DUF1996 domain-containing protein n=1 Tax=Nonomuraea angiospora TaxID=46172 RepID=UPI0029AD3D2B|nr:DUF1996 domain-containing protein [Nonomuraea angiospora]MDX3105802.1 DUF1996 domain-containing protein [Nonomuraea angiospora]
MLTALAVMSSGLTAGTADAAASGASGTAFAPTISCPSVADRLGQVPDRAQAEVQRNLQLLESQIAEANRRLAGSAGQGGPNFVQNAILGPLRDKRAATLQRIQIAFQRAGAQAPTGLQGLAGCTAQDDETGNNNGDQGNDDQNNGDQNNGDQNNGDQNNGDQNNGDQNNGNQNNGNQNNGDQGNDGQGNGDQNNGGAAGQISCPSVADRLGQIPDRAQAEVQRNLQLLESQIAEANRRLAGSAGQGGPNFVQNAILGPLRDKRAATLQRIQIAFQRAGAQAPASLRTLATCELRNGNPGNGNGGNNGNNGGGENNGDGGNGNGGDGENNGNNGNGGGQARGPVPADFVDIRSVRPNVRTPRTQQNGSRGTFSVDCGRNEGRIFNSDNVIVAPGVSNGAQHTHDYVGNESTNNQSTNESLLAASTTCRNGDKSTHYWPVLRALGQEEFDANRRGGGLDLNVGKILTPVAVQITFKGNPTGKVVAAPQFLRIITGNARVGGAEANAGWTCTGFENRQLTDKYPLCPRGSRLVRVFDFQSCWDGQNVDSANHRTHVTFPQADGSCPQGFQPIPALEHRLVYNVPQGPNFAVDTFPEELHKPVTDHSDFINLMNEQQMGRVVDCINSGRRCR